MPQGSDASAPRVFRLAKIHKLNFPAGSAKPLVSHFRLSDRDRAAAKSRGTPVRLSVFDCLRTTTTEGRGIYCAGLGLTVETEAYWIYNEDIENLRLRENPEVQLRIVPDPRGPCATCCVCSVPPAVHPQWVSTRRHTMIQCRVHTTGLLAISASLQNHPVPAADRPRLVLR
jgi:hypothetical protein